MTADPPPTREIDAIVFDVGETLIDETALWLHAAELTGVPPFTLMGVLGGLAARGEPHTRVWDILGVERPASHVGARCVLPGRACPASRGCATRASSPAPWATRPSRPRRCCGPMSTSSGRRPGGACTSRRRSSSPGSRTRQGSRPAASPTSAIGSTTTSSRRSPRGMLAIHIRRGPWGHLHQPPPAALAIRSLDELPAILSQRPAGTPRRGSRPPGPVGDVP